MAMYERDIVISPDGSELVYTLGGSGKLIEVL